MNWEKMDFRFERMEVYQLAIEISDPLFEIAEKADQLRKYRFASQLEGAALSITNNIAEGSGSDSDLEFARFIGISRKSVYECANILLIMHKRGLIDLPTLRSNYQNLIQLSTKLYNFRKNIIQRHKTKLEK